MMPTRRRAGAWAAGVSPAARTVLRGAGIDAPLVPVPVGYRTSGAAHTVVGRGVVLVLLCVSCGGAVPLQPAVSRGRTPKASVGPVRAPRNGWALCRGSPGPTYRGPGSEGRTRGRPAWARW